jgi:serine/threonine protein kinase
VEGNIMMDEKRICPGCQKALPPDVPLGLCPECLIQAGFKTGSESGGEGAGFIAPPAEEIAKLFPQLEIIGLIGKGGMGAVYKARQAGLDRFVALKILPPRAGAGPGFAERFNREARALGRLTHPNIVAVHEFGQAGGLHYLVMEYVDGANLREVERAGRLAPEQALAIVPQICEALQFAHNEGIVHRDIKPENILLDKKGRVKITDFGIAKMIGQTAGKASLTGAKDVVGTPHYMAPEQIEHAALVDHRADIFSLGVVFYEMLTGELPLGKFQPPSQKVQVDVRLDEVVLHALEKEPDRRYQQVSELKTQVDTIATTPGGGGGATAPSGSQVAAAPSIIRLPATPFSKIIELAAEIFFNLMVLAAGGFLSYWMLRVPLDYLGHPESKAPLYFSLCMVVFGVVSAVDQFFRLRKANLTLYEVFARSMEEGMARRAQQGVPAARERPATRFSRIINWTAVILIGFWYLMILLGHFGYPMGSRLFIIIVWVFTFLPWWHRRNYFSDSTAGISGSTGCWWRLPSYACWRRPSILTSSKGVRGRNRIT